MFSLLEVCDGEKFLSQEEVSNIQSIVTKANNGKTPKGSLAAVAQRSLKKSHEGNIHCTDPIVAKVFPREFTRNVSKVHAAKITSVVAQTNRGRVERNSFAAKVQSAADRNEYRVKELAKIQTMIHSSGHYPITRDQARLLQSITARKTPGGIVRKGSEAALAQSAAEKALKMEATTGTGDDEEEGPKEIMDMEIMKRAAHSKSKKEISHLQLTFAKLHAKEERHDKGEEERDEEEEATATTLAKAQARVDHDVEKEYKGEEGGDMTNQMNSAITHRPELLARTGERKKNAITRIK